MKCPYCGAETQKDICEFCGSEIPKEKTPTTVNITNNYYNSAPNTGDAGQIPNNNHKKKKHLFLWIIGWLFIFPVPLTIIMLRAKKLKPVFRYVIIAFAWIIYFVIGFSGTSDGNNTADSNNSMIETQAKTETTSEKNQGNTKENTKVAPKTVIKEKTHNKEKKPEVGYDKLQKVFLAVSFDTTENDIQQLIKENDLKYTVKEYNGTPKSNVYKIAYEDGVAVQSYADSGDDLEVTFNQDDGTLMFAEYYNDKSFSDAILYNYGTYWEFSEKKPDNKYSGYYYHVPGDNEGGMTITYDNGNSVKTGYHKITSGKKAIQKVIGKAKK